MVKFAPLLTLAALLLPGAFCCSDVYLHKRRSMAEVAVASEATCTYNHVRAGRDWPKSDEECSWTCGASSQSPINVPTSGNLALDPRYRANLNFGIATNLSVINMGHAIQVEFNEPIQNRGSVVVCGKTPSVYSFYKKGDPNKECTNPRRINITPLQFHFHSTSEHLLDGKSFQMELHIVTRLVPTKGVPMPKECPTPDQKCLAVFGVMYDLRVDADAKKGDPLIQRIINALPKHCEEAGSECHDHMEGEIDLGGLLPGAGQHYYTYTGSLTTPPCSEGVMWHVFDTVRGTITQKQLVDLQLAVSTAHHEGAQIENRMNNRHIQARNSRNVFAA